MYPPAASMYASAYSRLRIASASASSWATRTLPVKLSGTLPGMQRRVGLNVIASNLRSGAVRSSQLATTCTIGTRPLSRALQVRGRPARKSVSRRPHSVDRAAL